MQYRPLGKTGLNISVLGFGAMRLDPDNEKKSIAVLRRGFELGINYVDTAYGYVGGQSEIFVGKALKGYRDKVVLSTKSFTPKIETRQQWENMLDDQLKKLDVDCIDVYHQHMLTWDAYRGKVEPMMDLFYKAKEAGKIRHIAFSTHESSPNAIKLLDTGHFESMTIKYNFFKRDTEEAIIHAGKKNIGVTVMGPMGGGRLSSPRENLSEEQRKYKLVDLAFRFVLSCPGVTAALSGMNSLPMVEENVGLLADPAPINQKEREILDDILETLCKMAKPECSGCEYCMPCPQGVHIEKNLKFLDFYRVWEQKDEAKTGYADLVRSGEDAGQCLACGECEPKCPQQIPIIARLKEAVDLLS
jgi:predicted aldo/keto reductase-like oxidoreductase